MHPTAWGFFLQDFRDMNSGQQALCKAVSLKLSLVSLEYHRKGGGVSETFVTLVSVHSPW